MRSDEPSAAALDRADAALRHAKRSGRNLTCLDAGDGPKWVEPPLVDGVAKRVLVA
jgi:hypothetical protein